MKTLSAMTGAVVCTVLLSTVCSAQDPALQPPRNLNRERFEAQLPACYAFFDQAGRPVSDSLYWAPAVGRIEPGGGATKVDFNRDHQKREGHNSWRVDSLADTVRIRFHSGYSGTDFVLGLGPKLDTLRGRAIAHWDIGPPFTMDAGYARAVRVACSER